MTTSLKSWTVVAVMLVLVACKQAGVTGSCDRTCLDGERCDAATTKCVRNEPPAIRLDSPTAQQLISTPTFHLVGLATDEDFSFEDATVTFEGTTGPLGVNHGGDFDQVLTAPTADGRQSTISVSMHDLYGAVGTASVEVRLDQVAPVCVVLSPAAGIKVNGQTIEVVLGVTDGSNQLGKAGFSLDHGGTWTDAQPVDGKATFTVPLPQGVEQEVQVALRGTDAAGNGCTAMLALNVDTLAPTVTVTAPTSPVIKRQPGGTLEVTFDVADGDGVASAEVLAPPSPSWQAATLTNGTAHFVWTLPAADDGVMRTLQVRATDVVGNVTTKSVPLTIDVIPPTCVLLAPMDGASFTGSTLATTIQWSVSDGSQQYGSTEVSTDNGATWLPVTLTGGTASYGWALDPTWDGVTKTVRVRATDAAGNACVEQTATVSVDVVGPQLTITAPANLAVVGTPVVAFAGAVTDGNTASAATVKLDFADGSGPRNTAVSAGGWSLVVPTSASEDFVQHVVTVRATDAAGNVTTKTVKVIVDRVAPQLQVLAPTEGQLLGSAQLSNGATVLQAQATDGDPSVVTEVQVGSAWQPVTMGATQVATSATDNGAPYSQVLRARDTAGNTTQVTRTWKVDRVAPTVVSTTPAGGGLSGGRQFAVQFSEAVAVSGTGVPVTFTPAAPVTAAFALDGTNTVMTVTGLDGDQGYAAQVIDTRIADLAGNPLVPTAAVSFRTRPARPSNGQVILASSATQQVEWFRSSVDADGVVALMVRVVNPSTSVRSWLLGWVDPKTGQWTLQDTQPALATGGSLTSFVEQVNGAPRRRASAWLGDGTTSALFTYGTAGSVTSARAFAPPLATYEQAGSTFGSFVTDPTFGVAYHRAPNPLWPTYDFPVALGWHSTDHWGLVTLTPALDLREIHLDCTIGTNCYLSTCSTRMAPALDCSGGPCTPCDQSYTRYVSTPGGFLVATQTCSQSSPMLQGLNDSNCSAATVPGWSAFASLGLAPALSANDEAWVAWTDFQSSTRVNLALTTPLVGQPFASKTLTVETLQPLPNAVAPSMSYVIEPVPGPSTVGLLYVTNGALMYRE